MVFVAAAGQAYDGAAGVLVPVGGAQTGEGGHHVAAVGVRHLAGHVLGVAAVLQNLQLVPKPLNGCTGDENGTFQRIVHLAVQPPGDGSQQTVFAAHGVVAGVHQQKAAGAVGVFGLALVKAGLAEQRGLLVACCTGDFDGTAEVHRVGILVKFAVGNGLGQHAAGDVQQLQDVVVPIQRVDVEQHRPAGVGVVGHMHLAAGQLPDQPGLHGAERQLPGLGLFPRTLYVVQDPL